MFLYDKTPRIYSPQNVEYSYDTFQRQYSLPNQPLLTVLMKYSPPPGIQLTLPAPNRSVSTFNISPTPPRPPLTRPSFPTGTKLFKLIIFAPSGKSKNNRNKASLS